MVVLIVLALAVLLGLAVALEGWRQQRKLGKDRGQGTAMVRTGMLELQAFLEPERKVEMLQKQNDGEALLVKLHRKEEQGDGS